jgi:hypothetical protein
MEPFEFERGEYQALCAIIGEIAINWAQLELQIEICVSLTFTSYGGRQVADRDQIPREFKRKAKYLRQCFSTLGALKPLSSKALDLLNGVTNAASDRNFILHGSLKGIDRIKQTITFRRLDSQDDAHSLNEMLYTYPKLYSIAGTTQTLAQRFLDLNKSLL